MKINNISINTIKWLIAIFYVSALLVQLLVVLKVIPYNWVNGGMSESYQAQLVQSLISLVIISTLFVFVWSLAHQNGKVKRWKLRALYIITILWLLGLFMQIAGTEFERDVLSLSLLLGVMSHGTLVLRIRSAISP
jgi:membrane-associated HD superfamily phosphohydrolase